MTLPASFTDEQACNARLAQALREMIPHVVDAKVGEVEGIPILWRADNIRETLLNAADLIDELTIKEGHPK